MNGAKIALEEMTLRQLRLVASEYKVSRYSRMRKVELVAAIRLAQAARKSSEAAAANTTAETASAPASPVSAAETPATDMPVSATGTPAPAAETPASATEAPVSATVSTASAVIETVPAAASAAAPEKPELTTTELATVDDELGDLPGGYGESCIVLMPRDPHWAYVYWDIPAAHKEAMRRQGGVRLAIRFYDVTDIDINVVRPHSLQQYECDEMGREWFLPVPVSDRDYVAEIGYVAADGRWFMMARSTPIHVPPVYPSEWIEDHFVTVDWNNELRGNTVMTLPASSQKATMANSIYDDIFARAQSMESQRVAGSVFGSMHHVPEQTVSSFVFPSGMGTWALPTASSSRVAGQSASTSSVHPYQFWLVADAELIVYGATEPDATVTIGDRNIDLQSDGTFRHQMSFQDGEIDYPIKAVAATGEQACSIHIKFTRETPEGSTHTNAKATAAIERLTF